VDSRCRGNNNTNQIWYFIFLLPPNYKTQNKHPKNMNKNHILLPLTLLSLALTIPAKSLAENLPILPAKIKLNIPKINIKASEITTAGNKQLIEGLYSQNLDASMAFQQAVTNYNRGEYSLALTKLKEALSYDPNISIAYYLMGNSLAQTGEKNEAIASYQQAIKLNANIPESYYNLALLLHEKKDYELALANYQNALIFNPKFAEAHYNMGVIYESLGKPEEAMIKYQEAIKFKPDYAEPHYNIGLMFMKKEQAEPAIAEFQKAVSVNPNLAGAQYQLGVLSLYKDDFPTAQKALGKAVELMPNFADAHLALGSMYLRQGNPKGASMRLKKALTYDSKNVKIYEQLGSALVQIGEYKEATKILQQALGLADEPITHYNLAVALHRTGKYEEAIAEYREATLLNPNLADAFYNMGLAVQKLKRKDDAIALMTEAKNLFSQQNNTMKVKQIDQLIEQLTKSNLNNSADMSNVVIPGLKLLPNSEIKPQTNTPETKPEK
jgi:tetratricopeptide (TPR) repeat protein